MYVLLLLLSTIDGLFTIYWVKTGAAYEANVLLAPVLTYSPLLFLLIKTALVTLSIYILWRHREKWLAKIGFYACLGAYSVLNCYHIKYLIGY